MVRSIAEMREGEEMKEMRKRRERWRKNQWGNSLLFSFLSVLSIFLSSSPFPSFLPPLLISLLSRCLKGRSADSS
jgi:hypothetical protein